MARKKSRSKKSRARKSGPAKASAESPPAESRGTEAVESSSESDASGEDAPKEEKKKPRKKRAAKQEASKKEATEKEPDAEESQETEKQQAAGESKKKRKRKGRKKKTPRKAEKEKEEAPPENTPEPSMDDGVALDDEDELSVEDLVAATVALDDDVEAIPIDVDEDDGDARARLIAETLALVAQEESDATQASGILELADELRRGESSGTPAGDTSDPAAAGHAEEDDGTEGSEPRTAGAEVPTKSVDEEAQPPHTQPTRSATSTDAEYGKAGSNRTASSTEASDAADEARPLIGPQALLALSEIHAEGLARLPDELILDLGEASTPQERDRLLAAALAHAEMQEAIYRVPTGSTTVRRVKLGIAAVVALLALFAAVRPPALVVPEAPASLTVADRDRGVRVALLLQAQQIEAHRVRTGTLPRSLDEVPARLPGVRFVRSSGRSFQLVAYTSQGEPIVYDSAAPDPEFDDVGGLWSSRTEAS